MPIFEASPLAILGFLMVLTFTVLIMTRLLSAMTALILIPTLFALIGGFASGMGGMMLAGVSKLAPTGLMLMFAILYFSILNDTGFFTPLSNFIIKAAKGDPLKILVGTAILSLLVSLDGDGASTYLIVLTAMFPLYERLQIKPIYLSAIVMLAVGITNLVPWGGPTARAASALHLDPATLFVPMLPTLLMGALWVIVTAYILGLKERKRLGSCLVIISENVVMNSNDFTGTDSSHNSTIPTSRERFLINLLMTIALLFLLIQNDLPMSIIFMVGSALLLIVNFPKLNDQKACLGRHAGNILFVVSLVFAAGIFMGILCGTHMVDAMTHSMLALISSHAGRHLPIITSLLSIPMTFFISNDAFYFGVLPILAKIASSYGISPATMGRASLIGQPFHLLSPLVPSTYLLVNLAKVEFDSHQRFTAAWAIGSCFVLFIFSVVIGLIPY